MGDVTLLTFYSEGFSTSETEVTFTYQDEIHPAEMAETVESLFLKAEQEPAMIATFEWLAEQNNMGMQSDPDPLHEYIVCFIPEEMDSRGIPELGHRDDVGEGWDFRDLTDWMDNQP